MENGADIGASKMKVLRAALEAAGVRFIDGHSPHILIDRL
jgi:hypothetical protein